MSPIIIYHKWVNYTSQLKTFKCYTFTTTFVSVSFSFTSQRRRIFFVRINSVVWFGGKSPHLCACGDSQASLVLCCSVMASSSLVLTCSLWSGLEIEWALPSTEQCTSFFLVGCSVIISSHFVKICSASCLETTFGLTCSNCQF